MPKDSVKIEMRNGKTGEWIPMQEDFGALYLAVQQIEKYRTLGSQGSYRIVQTTYFPYVESS